eukprot:gnl/Dysnectes_brevis/1833_a2103_1632.p1 GENE.gnl/Dysnectes_brevis/1833_a2103_1632~~gnl/Dysnectes_brevis/1833_a2103_1632.p1  ORF type:complete len:490 (+),score=156.48 gnl/Dysnectes_brevis/1833_a2103_1632:89-1558(+)
MHSRTSNPRHSDRQFSSKPGDQRSSRDHQRDHRDHRRDHREHRERREYRDHPRRDGRRNYQRDGSRSHFKDRSGDYPEHTGPSSFTMQISNLPGSMDLATVISTLSVRLPDLGALLNSLTIDDTGNGIIELTSQEQASSLVSLGAIPNPLDSSLPPLTVTHMLATPRKLPDAVYRSLMDILPTLYDPTANVADFSALQSKIDSRSPGKPEIRVTFERMAFVNGICDFLRAKKVQTLILDSNGIIDLHALCCRTGLPSLPCLRALSIKHNRLESTLDLRSLKRLPQLVSIAIEGNEVASRPGEVSRFLSECHWLRTVDVLPRGVQRAPRQTHTPAESMPALPPPPPNSHVRNFVASMLTHQDAALATGDVSRFSMWYLPTSSFSLTIRQKEAERVVQGSPHVAFAAMFGSLVPRHDVRLVRPAMVLSPHILIQTRPMGAFSLLVVHVSCAVQLEEASLWSERSLVLVPTWQGLRVSNDCGTLMDRVLKQK